MRSQIAVRAKGVGDSEEERRRDWGSTVPKRGMILLKELKSWEAWDDEKI